jgi:hypothetical protein
MITLVDNMNAMKIKDVPDEQSDIKTHAIAKDHYDLLNALNNTLTWSVTKKGKKGEDDEVVEVNSNKVKGIHCRLKHNDKIVPAGVYEFKDLDNIVQRAGAVPDRNGNVAFYKMLGPKSVVYRTSVKEEAASKETTSSKKSTLTKRKTTKKSA